MFHFTMSRDNGSAYGSRTPLTIGCDLQTTPTICHRQHIVKTQILSEFKILTEFEMRNMNVRVRILLAMSRYIFRPNMQFITNL